MYTKLDRTAFISFSCLTLLSPSPRKSVLALVSKNNVSNGGFIACDVGSQIQSCILSEGGLGWLPANNTAGRYTPRCLMPLTHQILEVHRPSSYCDVTYLFFMARRFSTRTQTQVREPQRCGSPINKGL